VFFYLVTVALLGAYLFQSNSRKPERPLQPFQRPVDREGSPPTQIFRGDVGPRAPALKIDISNSSTACRGPSVDVSLGVA